MIGYFIIISFLVIIFIFGLMGDIMFRGQIYEYTADVTQLSATSEVAAIGLTLTCPTGERAFMIAMTILVEDIAADKTIQQFIRNVATASIAQQSTAADNEYDRFAPIQTNVGQGVAQVDGVYQPTILGGGMSYLGEASNTLDAEKKITIRLVYWSREHIFVSAVKGAGISIANEVHKAI